MDHLISLSCVLRERFRSHGHAPCYSVSGANDAPRHLPNLVLATRRRHPTSLFLVVLLNLLLSVDVYAACGSRHLLHVRYSLAILDVLFTRKFGELKAWSLPFLDVTNDASAMF